MLLKVCSRSQGQPRCGSRRRAISASSAPRARSASLIGRPGTQPIEGKEHPGGGAPDVAITVWDLAKLQLLAADRGAAAVPVMIGGIEQVIEGHLEGVLNLLGIERQLEARLHQGDHGRDAKAADHDVVRQVTDDRYEALRQADLLARFAQCRSQRAAVGALDAPARETDLAGVIAQLRRA